MLLPVFAFAAAFASAPADTARLVGSMLVIEPAGIQISLPPEWFGAKDSISWPPTCGHSVHGPIEQRLATAKAVFDSLRHRANGEWDREYVGVTDSMLSFAHLVAQVGVEPLGSGHCFLDLQMRVYVFPTAVINEADTAAALRTARTFFPSATLAAHDSAQWHIDRLRWAAWYSDYGAEANVEVFRTSARGRTLVLVFMHTTQRGGPAERDEQFILQHLRLQ